MTSVLARLALVLMLGFLCRVPDAVANDSGDLSAGIDHTCLLTAAGSIACFGYGEDGALNFPTGAFVEVSAGWHVSCARRADGTVTCWGSSFYAPLALTAPSGTFTALSAGGDHVCALRPDGSITCWGNNPDGRATAPDGTFTAVSAGVAHSCALRSDQTIICWGDNLYGQRNAPAGSFLSVSAGGYHSCALRLDGTAVCWGDNSFGATDAPPGFFSSISSGGRHSCAIRLDGTATCWGMTLYGQSWPDDGTYLRVSAGWAHTCADRMNGTRDCWGAGYFGRAPRPYIEAGRLPDARQGDPYSRAFGMFNGYVEYVPPTPGFAVVEGALPAGMQLTPGGLLTGTPTEAGEFLFLVEGEDANGFTASRNNRLVVLPPADTSAPVITPSISGTPGNNGWYRSDVNLSWSVVDSQSSVSATIGCQPASITTDTAGIEFTCTATSAGGTNSASVTIRRDGTVPTLSPATSASTMLLHGGGSATANASDAMSGVATQSCAALDAGTAGGHTVQCSATDNAGNSATASASYSVVYGFTGFTSPIDNAPIVNLANAGQAIPFKWRLTDANGAPVPDLAGASLGFANVTCSDSEAADALEQYASTATPLQNLGNGYYQYNWKSPKAWQGSCKQLFLDLGDGSARGARFRFK